MRTPYKWSDEFQAEMDAELERLKQQLAQKKRS